MTVPFPGHERARHMGVLERGEQRWNVYLEVQPDAELGAVRGRIHFVRLEAPAGDEPPHRMTSWVFLEWSEGDIQDRFREFSGAELWQFVESLA